MVSTIIYVEFAIYLIALLLIGAYGGRLTETASDYLLGGRKLNLFSAALSEQASLWSGWLVVGFPALIYANGVSSLWWMVWQIPLGIVTWGILAKRIGRYSRVLKSLTIPGFLSARHGDSRHLIRLTSTLVIGIFMTGYIAGQLLAAASAIAVGFDLSYDVGFLIALGIVVIYTVMGGFTASSYTDVLQALLMTAFAIVVPIAVLIAVGGPTELMTQFNNAASENMTSFTGGRTPYEFLIFSTIAVIALGGLGQPHGVVRYMGMARPSKAGYAMVVAIVFMLIALIGIPIIALGGVVMLPGVENQDLIAPMMILETLPPWLAGFLLAGGVAAIMSTADSQLLVAGSAFGEDVYSGIINQDASDQSVLLANRVAVLGIGVLAAAWAWITPGSVHTTILFAWAGLGAGLGPALVMSVYWKKTTGTGVIAGMVTGLVTTIVWNQLSGGPFMVFDIYELLPAFTLALLAVVIGSYLSGPPERGEKQIERELNEIAKPLQEEIDIVRDRHSSATPALEQRDAERILAVTEENIVTTYLSNVELESLSIANESPISSKNIRE
ncbi:sodium/proline symporter [Halomarina pelagica]|uniref:sodium/proline symporter n=1 Tax=Halomarina pelagica TaxID=2961599 RepID=UPI0020C41629|nr:sodium/proline symporter [Halomarina sp. BND7]